MPDEKDSIIISLIEQKTKLEQELNKLKEQLREKEKEKELSKDRIIALSELVARAKEKKLELSDEIKDLLNKCSDLIIRYGKESGY